MMLLVKREQGKAGPQEEEAEADGVHRVAAWEQDVVEVNREGRAKVEDGSWGR